jgi:hypothetical protein
MTYKSRFRRKAFGKFDPNRPLSLREFEVEFRMEARSGPSAWRSKLRSVQKLLDHLWRYTRSESSREKYLRTLLQFSKWSGLGPEELVRLPKGEAGLLVQEFADRIALKNWALTRYAAYLFTSKNANRWDIE